MVTHLGVTGTREGMTQKQEEAFKIVVQEILSTHTIESFHQGQCIGVDVEAADILFSHGIKIVSHPPLKSLYLGTCKHVDESRIPLSYFARNRAIVNEVDLLLVVPNTNQHRSYGGTWYTHDYALTRNKSVIIIYPDGYVEYKVHA